jgi:hypothetical protein
MVAANGGNRLVEGFVVGHRSAGDDDACALPSELARDASPHAFRTTSNDRNLSVQSHARSVFGSRAARIGKMVSVGRAFQARRPMPE